MSANTSISEGGKGYPFGPVKCLMVEGDNGEFYPWYPESDRVLDSLSVTQNGIYRASDRGVYGWDRVSVNVAQTDRVTGRDPDTGDEKTVTADPETGELVETVVPVEIRVITPPTKTEYQDGEAIDISGMVVKAYGANWDEMQIVPLNEIRISPSTASASGEKTQELDGKTVSYAEQRGLTTTWWVTPVSIRTFTSNGKAVEIGGFKYLFSTFSSYLYTLTPLDPQYEPTYGEANYRSSTVIADGQTIYYSSEPIIESLPHTDIGDINEVANILFNVNSRSVGSEMQVSVQWNRPGDGAVLETSFDISVTGGE